MKAIETKYHGPTNTKGSRISATDCGDHTIYISYDSALNSDDAHKAAAIALREKLNWSGPMQGGHTKNGMVWVFEDRGQRIESAN